MENSINVFTDGGSRGNPGNAAFGVYITDFNGNEIAGFGKKIGIATNNVAEYKGVIGALDWIAENKQKLGITKVYFFLDSLLVYSQILGLYKVKDANLKLLVFSVLEKEKAIRLPIVYKHIPREKNKNADMHVNKALDAK